MGRAARNVNGKVIMYADTITGSMRRAIDETNRRRKLQIEYNRKHNITPQTVQKSVRDVIEATMVAEKGPEYKLSQKKVEEMPKSEIKRLVQELEKEMHDAAKALEFERAAVLRDLIIELKGKL